MDASLNRPRMGRTKASVRTINAMRETIQQLEERVAALEAQPKRRSKKETDNAET